MVNFLCLPHEVLTIILSQIDFPAYLALCHVHFTFFQIFQANAYLKYLLACQIAGAIDNDDCNLPLHERHEILRRSESGWDHLDVDFECALKVQHQFSNLCIVSHGTVIMGDVNSPTTIHYCKLPSSAEESRLQSWGAITLKGDNEPMEVSHIDLDISQDLLALGTSKIDLGNGPISTFYIIEIHLLQFSTGEPHPLAQNPVLSIAMGITSETGLSTFQINGKHAAIITFREDTITLSVLEWTTSKVRMRRVIHADEYCYDILFLSESLVLVSNPKDATLDIYPISSQDDKIISKPTLSLRIPALSSSKRYLNILCASTQLSRSRVSFSPRPYHDVFENTILSFEVDIYDGTPEDRFFLIVHRSALVKLWEETSKQPVRIPVLEWEAWGPLVTRWLHFSKSRYSFSMVASGQRCAFFDRKEGKLTILDFNPLRVRKSLHKAQAVSTGVESGSSDSDSGVSHVAFRDTVRSELPYRSISRPFKFHGALKKSISLSDFYFDEERLIELVKKGPDAKPYKLQISHIGRKSTESVWTPRLRKTRAR